MAGTEPLDLKPPARTWSDVQKHLEDQLDLYRRQNDAVTLDAEETAHLRGKIAEVNRLLALDKEPLKQEDEPPIY